MRTLAVVLGLLLRIGLPLAIMLVIGALVERYTRDRHKMA